ncbi:MAG: NADH-quinone oxidoreductase subunit L [Bacteroidota bacterium]|nr:NADH-quinone oxidoreductase subunit L [Bacteroidota bacterium]MDP4229689.1 NADH-quinone oxidoreductase subunit L [Bacteroidota bacterium]MDP4235063.1 NADH-quinone oxidoreductase subunit L [Bacteroidota bacterium]
MSQLIPYIVAAPLVGFLINGFFGGKYKNKAIAGWVASMAVTASFVMAIAVFSEMLSMPAESRAIHYKLFDWLSVGKVNVGISYLIDQLSIIFILVITGVGALIHLYSTGYMKGDPGYTRFFTYLNLFIVMMLQLVMADNYLLTFLGWEGVGLCSYLLIGFWFEENKNNDAAKKAFIVNRIGDFGFLVAMGVMLVTFGSLNFSDVFGAASGMGSGNTSIVIITMMLFLGCTGKSAQIPLYVWLPDAMAGPTPVSALIHAATMVTSGIYLVARSNILFALSPATLTVISIVAICTALLAAIIALFQNDIKKVLAYSTVSQLGYMFLGLGVGAFGAGVFHVMTHAFFKACLFLGSGAVIHAMHHEQDMQKMGGLKKYLPITFATFLIATLAIAGIPPFAGFFSKDEILWKAFSQGSTLLWVLGAFGALMTAFYMFRAVYLTFYGKERFDAAHHPPHEVVPAMWIPLVALAALSVLGGFLGVPKILGGGETISQWLEPIVGKGEEIAAQSQIMQGEGMEIPLVIISVVVALVGILMATRYYKKRTTLASQEQKLGTLYSLSANKFYVDEIYDKTIVQPTYFLSNSILYKIVDVKIIDGIINGSAAGIGQISGMIRKIQTGIVQNYAVMIVVGILVLVSYVLIF